MAQWRMTHNIASIKANLSQMPIYAQQELKSWVTELSVWTKESLKNKVPVKTGTLQRSIKYKTNIRANDISVDFSWEWYGKVLDEGSSFSGIIYPKSARAFKFYIGESATYAKSVHIKPIKARNWSMDVFNEAESKASGLADRISTYILGMVKPE